MFSLKKLTGFSLPPLPENCVIILCILFCFQYHSYSRNILGLNWLQSIRDYTFIAAFILIILQASILIERLKTHDYLSIGKKIIVSLLLAFSIATGFLHYKAFRIYQIASTQPTFTLKKTAFLDKRRYNSYVAFEFDNENYYLPLSHHQARHMIEQKRFNIEACISLQLQKGLYNTYVVKSFEILSCH